jgi:hypothetical protein
VTKLTQRDDRSVNSCSTYAVGTAAPATGRCTPNLIAIISRPCRRSLVYADLISQQFSSAAAQVLTSAAGLIRRHALLGCRAGLVPREHHVVVGCRADPDLGRTRHLRTTGTRRAIVHAASQAGDRAELLVVPGVGHFELRAQHRRRGPTVRGAIRLLLTN